jgi:hypothetical protein
MDARMKEEEFGQQLALAIKIPQELGQLSCRKSLLYALSIDSDGNVRMGVDSDSGEPIRGQGKGFEQDLLIWEARESSHTSIVPRVSIELKLNRVTTHDAIVYSEKARRLRFIYPYARFGLVLGNLSQIPGRVLRLGQQFDFIFTLHVPFVEEEIKAIESLLINEVALSRRLSDLLEKGTRIRYLRRELILA